MSALDQLPQDIASKSISDREVVLPMEEALAAINLFESRDLLILGWEGWVKDKDGRVGHGSAPQGTVSLEALSVADAARLCRETIPEEASRWSVENLGSKDELHFCITVRV
jgi:hypothetical protein